MKKRIKTIFFVQFFLFLAVGLAFAQKKLEIEYPAIGGIKLETIKTSISVYAKYIFNFSVTIVGFIAFGALIWAGILYLTSSGQPERLKTARKQITAIVLGVLILLLSYLILITINPQLVIFRLPELKPPPLTYTEPPPISTSVTVKLLERIKEVADKVKTISEMIKNLGQEIKNRTDACDCQLTQPNCLCGQDCAALFCYGNPCPNQQEIKAKQQGVIALSNEINYYGGKVGRILAELADLTIEIKQIEERISYFEKRIGAEKKVLDQLTEELAKETQKGIIAELENGRDKLKEEYKLKQSLAQNLAQLAVLIQTLVGQMNLLGLLPDYCLTTALQKCQGSCSGGCHDKPGCFPVNCSGGNPCPTTEIQTTFNQIADLLAEIVKTADNIISDVAKINAL